MARGFGGAIMRVAGVGEWTIEVIAIEDLTPYYRRIEVVAPGFFDAIGSSVELGPATYIRLWAPDVDDARRQHQRGYTVVSHDIERERLTLDFVLHEPAGPASAWARDAEIGSTIAVTRFGIEQFTPPTPEPAGYLLVGDPASLPAINGVLGVIPPETPVEIVLESQHPEDRDLPIAEHPRARITWVPRTDDSTALSRELERRGGSAYGGWFAWVAAEKTAVKNVRAVLKAWGFPGGSVKARAYWAQGKEMGKSRDEAELSSDQTVAIAEPEPPVADGSGAMKGVWAASAAGDVLDPVRRTLWIAGVIQAFVSVLQVAPFVLLTELCRRLLDGDTDHLRGLATWAVVLFGIASLGALGLSVWLHLVDARFGERTRRRMVRHLGRLPLGWFDDRTSGRVRKAVQDDTVTLHYLVTHAVLELVGAVVMPVVVLVYLFVVHAGLAAVLLVPLIVYYGLMLRMLALAGDGVPTFERFKSEVSSEVVAFTDGAEVARVYDVGETSRIRRLLADRIGFFDAWQRPLVGLKTAVDLVTRPTTFLLIIAGVGGAFVIADWMSPADLVAFLLVGATFGARLMAIAYGFQPLKEGREAAGRIGLLLAEEPLTETESSGVRPADSAVALESVTFGYRPDRPVVHDLSLRFEPDTVTAVVGPSGAGKSTLAALLARFHDIDSGRVTIGGVDVRELTQADLYAHVGFVFQGGSTVRASLHDNIALGRPEATRDDVERAARAAQIHDRIVRDRLGYDAVLGDDTWLSGGELQRLAIARVLLADPPILVLDEATASADPESEHLVQQALSELAVGRTVLVIAHRLHTIVGADRIVVLEHGRVVQDGTHAELSGQDGLYAELWAASTVEVSA